MTGTHSFHIPVMGTGFTIDTPIKVARYGISSVISVGDDKLIEKMRRYYCDLYGRDYRPILEDEESCRARRITAYLNLVDFIVKHQVRALRQSPFAQGSEISKYFEWMDEDCPLKREYRAMLAEKDPEKKTGLQYALRQQVVSGSIDVNIMTKVDRENTATSALEGFAKSSLSSSVVFSAGLNLHLYSAVAEFDDFFPDPAGEFKKKVTLKVSDFRSALIQAKILAKRGIWVSEYRVESGLNCGGHAFPTDGRLLGPVLEEFKERKQELLDSLFGPYRDALLKKKGIEISRPRAIRVTAQGGVGTSREHRFLLRYFELDSVGWGSPFLLVPEATTVDDDTLGKLAAAGEEDIYLSGASPLGVPFYNLKNSASEEKRRQRIEHGRPGSPCYYKYLAFNKEFEQDLCTASYQYQTKKIKELEGKNLSGEELLKAIQDVTEKSCICRDLGSGALLKYDISDGKRELVPAVCPGPNLAYFSRVCSLGEMIGHIYGKTNALNPAVLRAHLFVNELKLYVRYLKEAITEPEYFSEFKRNLLDGIEYYKNLIDRIQEESKQSREKFLGDLAGIALELQNLSWPLTRSANRA